MAAPHEADGRLHPDGALPAGALPGGSQPGVICAACGAKFRSEDAATGARVRCPLCREVVEVAELVATKRRYRSRTPRAPDAARRISGTKYRRLVRVFALGIAIAGAAATLWFAWETNRSNVLDHPIPSVNPR